MLVRGIGHVQLFLQLYPEMTLGESDQHLARHPGIVLLPHGWMSMAFPQERFAQYASARCELILGAHAPEKGAWNPRETGHRIPS